MKKIIILFIVILLTSGCYDYKEINELDIISAIGIDYQDEKYIVTLEVLNNQIDKDSGIITSYTKTGKDKILTTAIENAADKLSNQLTLSHVKLMVFSENLLKEKFSNVVDLFLRNTYFRENFYVISSLEHSPEELLNNKSDKNPVASTAIAKTLENISFSSNSNITKTFDEVIEEVLTFGIDTCFSNVTLKEQEFVIDGMVIFQDFNYKGSLNNDYAKIYNIMRGKYNRPTYSKKYDDNYFTISVNSGKISSSIENGKIKIKGILKGRVLDNDANFDIRSLDDLKTIDNDFSTILNDEITDFIKEIQNKKSDILGISKSYYQKERIKDNNYWTKLDIDNTVSFKINKKGLIYEVENEKK